MKSFVLITNNEKKKNIEAANEIRSLIEKKGGEVSWAVMPAPGDISPMEIKEGCEAIITIGGDGTMVRSAQRTLGNNIPLIGMNRGHLGYLCDINEENLEESIDHLLEGKYHIEERMMLSGSIGNSSDGHIYSALNDIVLKGKNGQAVIRVSIYVNGTFLSTFTGDGIIVSTPTGSTAYNLAASGPIVEPVTELILITPLNPHSLNTRSIVLDPSDEIVLVPESRRSYKKDFVTVSFDGGHRQNLSDKDRLYIRKAKEKTRFIRLDEKNFIERMQSRLGG